MTQDNDTVPAPDLVSAGVAAPPRAPMNLLGALGGGSLPPEVLALLAGPRPESMGQTLSNALGAGVFAGRGQANPIAAEQTAQHQARVQQANSLIQVLQRQQAMQQAAQQHEQRRALEQQKLAAAKAEYDQARKERRVDSLITVTQGVLNQTKDPAIKGPLAKQLEGLYKDTGREVPPSVVQAWSEAGGLAKEDQQALAAKLRSGQYADAVLQREYERRGLPAAEYAQMKEYLTSSAGLRASGLPTDEELHTTHLRYLDAKGRAFDAMHKEVGRGTPKGDYAAEAYRRARGKPIVEHDDDNPQDVAALTTAVQAGQQAALVDEQRKQAWEEHKLLLRDELAEKRAGKKEDLGPLSGAWVDREKGELVTPSKADFKKSPERYRHIGATEEQMFNNSAVALRMVYDTGTLLDRLTARYGTKALAESIEEPTIFNQAKQFFGSKIGKTIRNDPDWAQFFNLVTESNIELARVVGGSGQLRVTVLQQLKEAGLKGWETANVGHRILGTIETSVWNRRQSILSGGTTQGMRGYGVSPRETGGPLAKPATGQSPVMPAPATPSAPTTPRVVIGPDGKRRPLAPGYPLPEGYRLE